MPRPRLSSDETELWRRAMSGVTPLRDRPTAARPSRKGGRIDRPRPAPQAEGRSGRDLSPETAGEREPEAAVPLPPGCEFAGIDRRTADRLRRGRYPVEARLDLHGMTQQEAHRALAGFLTGARAEGRRCVLVITGHGRISGGILKAATPRWLAEPGLRAHVLTLAPARPQHGGGGALYVLLRRAGR
jgi:DNA-nicking Smr family endonuclease